MSQKIHLYGHPLEGYIVSRIPNGGDEWTIAGTLGPNETRFEDTNVTNGQYYHYAVAAENAHGMTYNDTYPWVRPHRRLLLDGAYELRFIAICVSPFLFCIVIFAIVYVYTKKRKDGYSWHDGKGEKFLQEGENGT